MIIKNKFCNWNYSFQKKLKYATFGPYNGLMCLCVSKDPNTMTYVYMNNIHIKGWAIIGNTSLGPAIMTFINKRYRKRGVGNSLVNYTINDSKIDNVLVFPHDSKSKALYKKIKLTHNKIKIMSIDQFYNINICSGNDPADIEEQW